MNTSPPHFPWQYLLLAYGLTWIFWIPIALTRQDYQSSPILIAIAWNLPSWKRKLVPSAQ